MGRLDDRSRGQVIREVPNDSRAPQPAIVRRG